MRYMVLEYRWITRTSVVSGKTRKIMVGATTEQWRSYDHGTLIQHALPDLSPQEREFLMTGITREEWDTAFKEDEA